jgi:hypothetical protein
MESSQFYECQCQCIPRISIGIIQVPPTSFQSWLKLTLKRLLSAGTKRKLKRLTSNLTKTLRLDTNKNLSSTEQLSSETQQFSVGDLVRVRSEQEIRATLNTWNELKGCMFMEGQRRYCNTKQRVLKTIERFVDERDYRVKKAKGIILLDDVLCEGTPDYGRCDRACFYFWREEWLEKIS